MWCSSTIFEIECDASMIGIRDILMLEKQLIAYFSEKLNGAALNYPTYYKKLYKHWRLGLLAAGIIYYIYRPWVPEVLEETGMLNRRHAKRMEFIETFPYVIKYKQGKRNVVVYALSRRYAIVSTLKLKNCMPMMMIF